MLGSCEVSLEASYSIQKVAGKLVNFFPPLKAQVNLDGIRCMWFQYTIGQNGIGKNAL